MLHPWTRALRDHPHVHDLGPGGGLTADDRWLPARPDVLVHIKPLSVLVRATFRDALHKTDLCPLVDAQVWHQDGVVHGAPVGRGAEALRYLAPASFRVAISHHRLRDAARGPRHRVSTQASATAQVNPCTLPAEACMRRLLQHVLPARCIQVRDDGLLSPTQPSWAHQGESTPRGRHRRSRDHRSPPTIASIHRRPVLCRVAPRAAAR